MLTGGVPQIYCSLMDIGELTFRQQTGLSSGKRRIVEELGTFPYIEHFLLLKQYVSVS